MALVRWEPVRELNSLQQDVNRLFNAFFEAPGGGQGGTLRRWIPSMDLVENETEYVLWADVPGMSEGDVTIELEDDVLTVSGERSDQHEDRGDGYLRVERATGSFSRSLSLPAGVDADKITATVDKGVLEVRIPKPEQVQPRRVQITAKGQD